MPEVACVLQNPDRLGECPLWDPRRRQLLWIDSLNARIHGLDPRTGTRAMWQMPDVVGSIGLRKAGGLIAAIGTGFATVDLENGEATPIAALDPTVPGTRLNDGKCDRKGRFWCGTMDEEFSEPKASLYRLDPDHSVHEVANGIMVSNGIAFSPDDTTLYFSDSRRERYARYDFDIETGDISNRRPFVDPAKTKGRIDGATVDTDGNYWAALFAGWAIGCFAPDGALLRRIELPVEHPTMCAFGDDDLATLYVTTATFQLSEDAAADQPLAGSLFAVSGTGARGLPEPYFLG